MLRIFGRRHNLLVAMETLPAGGAEPMPVWVDLLSPTIEEDKAVETLLGINIPSQDEMQEIELSSRLYLEDGAAFMTITAIINLDGDEPLKTPVTFILKGQTLVTVRYAEPKPFQAYLTRAQRPNAAPCGAGDLVMLGLLEAIVDRLADALERTSSEVDTLSHGVFRSKVRNATKKTHDLQSVIEQIGRKGDLLSMIQESLVSITRLISYHMALDGGAHPANKEGRQRAKLIERDTASLREHAASLTNKITFLLDATLGLISLEQNKIIKIFSVAAVVFLPPTLIASIYGMNFQFMPELGFTYGYPMALVMMVFSAILPFLYFKTKGWL